MSRLALPPLPDPFPPAFVAMLERLMRVPLRIDGGKEDRVRARRSFLQQSGSFVGHRSYARGDDLRRIDWNAYARTGSLFVKLLAEEEARTATLWLDASGSMRAGAPPRWTTAVRLAAMLGGLALAHLDALLLCGKEAVMLRGRAQSGLLLEQLAAMTCSGEAAFPERLLAGRSRGPLRVHWISDFVDLQQTERSLLRLRRSGCKVTGWLPTVPEDFAAPLRGWMQLADPETGQSRPVRIDADLAQAFERELQALGRQREQVFAACDVPLVRLRLPTDSFELGDWMGGVWGGSR